MRTGPTGPGRANISAGIGSAAGLWRALAQSAGKRPVDSTGSRWAPVWPSRGRAYTGPEPPGDVSHETHLSAQEAQARTHAWIPRRSEERRVGKEGRARGSG